MDGMIRRITLEELDLRQLWSILRKRWIILLVIPIIAPIAALTIGIISFYVGNPVPVYDVWSTVIVERKAPESTIATEQVLDNSVLQQHIRNYIELAQSRANKKNVLKDLNFPTTVEDLDSMIYIAQVSNTDMIKIQIINKNPALAASIVNSTARELSKAVSVDSVRIVDQAEIPNTPLNKSKTKSVYVLFAFLLGLIASFSLVFLLEVMDNTVKTSRDVKNLLGIPLLGVIVKYKMGKQGKNASINSLITLEQTKSPISESYRYIRTNIEFASLESVPQRILITSSGPHEGKSFMVANLAVSMAQIGKSVLVLDADMRDPTQHKLFGLDNGQGLSSALVQERDYRDYIRETAVPGLVVLTGGTIPPNPAELVGSKQMMRLIEEASEQFDVVLIDSPPVIAFTDAAIIAQQVDGVILVLASGEVNKDYAQTAKEHLDNVGAKIIGTILNKVDIKTSEYDHYYNYEDLKKKKNNGHKAH